jgi:hypothetical protein
MKATWTRRAFVKSLLAGAAGLSLPGSAARAGSREPFSFLLLGDLHYDKLRCHDLEALGKTKPDDVRQIRQYSSLATEMVPRLFGSVRETIAEVNRAPGSRVAFTAQLGDLVEGLCSNEELALQLNTGVLQMVKEAQLGVPFLFTKGNHDITGPGAAEAFKEAFYPFLDEQRRAFGAQAKLSSACYAFERGEALFCVFDAYDKTSLEWLESVLDRRTARHCFLLVHPPVVPYGARATWHLFSSEREKPQRERLLQLLGKNHVFVLSGHIHKYNLLVRSTPGGGRFLQLSLCSVVPSPEVTPRNELNGIAQYTPDQVSVEPHFSPGTESVRRAVYQVEAPFVKHFEYADLPGYAVLTLDGPRVTARIYPGLSHQVWRTLLLSDLLQS